MLRGSCPHPRPHSGSCGPLAQLPSLVGSELRSGTLNFCLWLHSTCTCVEMHKGLGQAQGNHMPRAYMKGMHVETHMCSCQHM